jgi:hypothetical protein
MAVLAYADIFRNVLVELYGQAQTSVDLYRSNPDIQIVNGKNLKIPKLTVSGYKDHTRGSLGFSAGSYSNDYEVKTLDHDRDIEFVIDPVDVDETNMVVTIANIQKRFETTQAIPEADCYTYSKLYSEAKRVGATIKNTALTTANVLSDFDDNLEGMSEAGVPLDRVILYCTPAYKKLLKNAEGIQRYLEVSGQKGIDRRVRSLDDIGKIIEVPSARLKTQYDFTEGCAPAKSAKQINYILIDPEAQVSRDKYSYINVFTPGTDSRTSDNYLYQNRKFNGTFGIDQLLKDGVIINAEAEE